ncbi:MAG: hypothetical protein LBL51_02040, partial [Synergistaceae bacterium]|nr:hypothetical protein [Synergistaceae bacterium]
MQDTIKQHMRKIALPTLLATGAFTALDSGAVPQAWTEFARERTGLTLDARAEAAKMADVAVMPELAGLQLNNPGLRQAVEALTVEHVPGNPAETAKAAMWQLYQLAEANKGDKRAETLMQALMFQAMGKYMEAVHWGKYNKIGDLGGFENFIKYDDIDIAEIPPIYIKETKRGNVVRRQGSYANPAGIKPAGREGEQWGIEYNGNNTATYNAPWDIYSAKVFNAAAAVAALDQANALLSGSDTNGWRASQNTPQMITDIADNRYPKYKEVSKTVNPYTQLGDYKKGQAIKSSADLTKFAEMDFFFLKPPTAKLDGMQRFWEVTFGTSDDAKIIQGYIGYSTSTNQGSGTTGFNHSAYGLL